MIKSAENCTDNKRISKGLVVFIVFAIILALGATVLFITQSTAVQERIAQKKLEKETFIWPDTYIASLIPIPQSNNGHIGFSNENTLAVDIYKTSEDDFLEYKRNCFAHSFSYCTNENKYTYSGYDLNENIIEISYDINNKSMSIYAHESEDASLLRGIKHYELEYYSYPYTVGASDNCHYDSVVKKYLTPKLTTVAALKKEFPFSEAAKERATIRRGIKLDDSDMIWVYASCIDDYQGKKIKLIYDKLNITDKELDIKTHFKVINSDSYIESYLEKSRLIVISIFPVDTERVKSSDISDLSEENMGVNYEYQDGLYIVDGDMAFMHRIVLTGKDPNARYGSKYIVLTNNPDITFEIVSRSLFSSNSNDWLTDTVIIGMHVIDDNGNIIPDNQDEIEDCEVIKTQTSPEGRIILTEYKGKVTCECDIDHDGKTEIISVDYLETLKDDQIPINMTITTKDDGTELWNDDYIGLPSCAWKTYYVTVIDDDVYLIEYYPPEESQGLYYYSCKVFNIDSTGNEVIYADISGDTEDAIEEFNKEASQYLDNAYLLISTRDGEINTNK
jgi:hypothetical protein